MEAIDVSIIIKAYNEEEHIARSIESALKALKNIKGEVIVADSLSTDRTIEIASRYPILMVQVLSPADRRCGIGPQLGYQVAKGEYLYILDGDMEIHEEFVDAALQKLETDPSLAGVAGLVTIVGGRAYEFAARRRRLAVEFLPGYQQWLACGGLYRRTAIEHVGYLSNRNLHANEEMELGLRLSSAGWKLERLPIPAIDHHVHANPTFQLMVKRWRSHYTDGPGELLRASRKKPYFNNVLKTEVKVIGLVGVWISFLMALLMSLWTLVPLITSGLIITALIIALTIRKRNLVTGVLAFTNLNLYAAGFVRGLCAKQVSPYSDIPYRIIEPH